MPNLRSNCYLAFILNRILLRPLRIIPYKSYENSIDIVTTALQEEIRKKNVTE